MAITDSHDRLERLQLALDAGRIACWQWNAATDHFTDDARAAAVTGFEQGSRIRTAYAAQVHEEDRAEWLRAWREAFAAGADGSYRTEYRLVNKHGGQVRRIFEAGHVISGGGDLRMAGFLSDITELRREAANHDVSTSQLSGILAIAVDAIISMDNDHNITMFNHGAETIFGYAQHEVIGQPLVLLLPEQHRAAHSNHVNRFATTAVQARRMGERSEILGRRKNGEIFPAEASISKFDIGSRRVYTAVLRDVTERKLAQALLEKKVEESTRELRAEMHRREESQAQLVRTQRMEAFGQLTGGVAHDFNNLLTVIIGNLELLEMRLADDKAKALLHRAKDAAGMGARLTGRLLTFARRRRYEAVPLDLNDLIIGMAELLERALGEQVHLTTTLERAPRIIHADPSEVENAILNLALNARDAMPKGGKLIIETMNVSFEENRDDADFKIQAGDYVRVSVSDTGVGMTPDVIRHAFEPFFTTKEPGKGTGLGLSSIYGFVQQAKGSVSIYSEIGKGTTISLYLPCHGAHVAQPARRDEDHIPRASGERILVVEDNADVRAVTVGQLEALGYGVVAVGSGPEAHSALANSGRFDLVFSDVVMAGGINGFELADWISTHYPHLPVLLASGYPDGILRADATRRQLPPIMRKPYSQAEIARRIRLALNGT